MKKQNLAKSQVICMSPATTSTPVHYDYDRILQSVTARGRELYGRKFQIFEEDKPAVLKLLCWFLKDEERAEEYGLDLNKGILLSGPLGCGKSTIMRVICSLCIPSWRFIIKPCTRLAMEFAQMGYGIITMYTVRSFREQDKPLTICFDDLGTESIIPQYGIPFNTMAGILPIRYDLFVEHKMLTHVTTHLSDTELEARYGARFTSQMNQLFNQIAFPQNSRDKRKV